MKLTEATLRAIHTQACTEVAKANRSVTMADEAFWPLYLQAAFNATEGAFADRKPSERKERQQ